MKCRCNFHSPFRWADFPATSRFATDPAFAKGSKSGLTMNVIQTQAMTRFEQVTGRNPGSIWGLSDKGNLQIEESRNERRKRSSGHYRGKA